MKINVLGIFCDDKGKKYELLEYVRQVKTQLLNCGSAPRDGNKRYETACGIPVNVVNGKFVTRDGIALSPFE